MSFNSPLRYPGGKGKTADLFSKLILDNNLEEAFMLSLMSVEVQSQFIFLFNNLVSQIVINDKDRSLFVFWHSVLHNTDQLCRLISDTPVTIDNWAIQKRNSEGQG